MIYKSQCFDTLLGCNYISYDVRCVYKTNITSMVFYQRKEWKICFSEISKVNVLSKPLLYRNYTNVSISIETYRFQQIVISEQQNAKSVADASIWINVTSKIAARLKKHSLLNSPIIIPFYGFKFMSSDLTNKPPS